MQCRGSEGQCCWKMWRQYTVNFENTGGDIVSFYTMSVKSHLELSGVLTLTKKPLSPLRWGSPAVMFP